MKKTLFSIAIMAASLLVASCGNKTAAPAAEAEEQTEQAEAAPAEEQQPASLADIVAKAKAEGAKWTTDEWKAQYKVALEAYKPFAVAMNEATSAEFDEITKKYADFPTLIKDFAATAMQTEGGKAIDNEWIQKTMEEMGIPHL